MAGPRRVTVEYGSEPCLIEYERDRREVYTNLLAFGLDKHRTPEVHQQKVDVGVAVIGHLRSHPGASDETLSRLAMNAVGLTEPAFDDPY